MGVLGLSTPPARSMFKSNSNGSPCELSELERERGDLGLVDPGEEEGEVEDDEEAEEFEDVSDEDDDEEVCPALACEPPAGDLGASP